MAASLQAVREAALDGRMHNILTRRAQLEALQKALLDKADTIKGAIRADTDYAAPRGCRGVSPHTERLKGIPSVFEHRPRTPG